MSWRDHLLEWLCALGVAVGTLLALHQIESRAAPVQDAPAPASPPSSSEPVQIGDRVTLFGEEVKRC